MKNNVVSLAEIKRRKMIAQYIAFYGNSHDVTRKQAIAGERA
jgi:hypothetical protein